MNSKVFYKYSQAKNIALVRFFAHSRSSLAGFAHNHLHDLVTKSMANARWPWLWAWNSG